MNPQQARLLGVLLCRDGLITYRSISFFTVGSEGNRLQCLSVEKRKHYPSKLITSPTVSLHATIKYFSRHASFSGFLVYHPPSATACTLRNYHSEEVNDSPLQSLLG
jgi:hypothetical protein